MLMATGEEEQAVRMYSKTPRVPVDVIAAQHVEVHADLERWGSWNRDRYEPGTCASVEKRYEPRNKELRPPHVSLPTRPRNLEIDRVVRLMSMSLPQHAETLKLFYVVRRQPQVICRLVVVHWKDFGGWMFDCRAMVINISKASA
jgi:hypothetical protein